MTTETNHLDDSEDALEYSPLERDVTRDGTTVHICIYRGRADAGWLLEIEDELGGSTVWDDLFESDQAALDEALQAIEQEGIHSFSEARSDPADMRRLWELTVAQPAIEALRQTLASSKGAMGFHRASGVFAAVASTPELRAPSEWLDLVKGDHVFEDTADVQDFANGVMALYNEVLRSVTELGAHCCPPPDDHDAVREFCAGYATIVLGDPGLSRDTTALAMLLPIFALAGVAPVGKLGELMGAGDEDPESWLQHEREDLMETVSGLYEYWAEEREAGVARLRQPYRRETPKVGRNERCPCGSGKKFKKCCAKSLG